MGTCPSKDMAIGIVMFNPAKSKRLILNYYEMIKHLKEYPVFTLELVYPDREPEISDAFHIYGKSVMFQKENLCRILERKIPLKFKKIEFIVGDKAW